MSFLRIFEQKSGGGPAAKTASSSTRGRKTARPKTGSGAFQRFGR